MWFKKRKSFLVRILRKKDIVKNGLLKTDTQIVSFVIKASKFSKVREIVKRREGDGHYRILSIKER